MTNRPDDVDAQIRAARDLETEVHRATTTGDALLEALAEVARRYGVAVNVSVTPLDVTTDVDATGDDEDD